MEPPGLDFGGSRSRFWTVLGSTFRNFRKIFGMLPRRCPSSTHSRNPSSDLFHVGRADAFKKMNICQVIERLPRIARLPHLKTQTPRTPRTPRTSRTPRMPRVKSSTTTAENKRVGRRWSPPGGLQYFWCRRAAGQTATRGGPARRAEVADAE